MNRPLERMAAIKTKDCISISVNLRGRAGATLADWAPLNRIEHKPARIKNRNIFVLCNFTRTGCEGNKHRLECWHNRLEVESKMVLSRYHSLYISRPPIGWRLDGGNVFIAYFFDKPQPSFLLQLLLRAIGATDWSDVLQQLTWKVGVLYLAQTVI